VSNGNPARGLILDSPLIHGAESTIFGRKMGQKGGESPGSAVSTPARGLPMHPVSVYFSIKYEAYTKMVSLFL
jgi:hypothetical protein